MDVEENLILVNMNTVCHTANCKNGEILIPVIGVQGSIVVCGVCSQQITDVVEMGLYNE